MGCLYFDDIIYDLGENNSNIHNYKVVSFYKIVLHNTAHKNIELIYFTILDTRGLQ